MISTDESPCPTVFCVKALCLIQQRNEPARGGTNDVDGSRFQTFGTLFDGFSTINTHPKIQQQKGRCWKLFQKLIYIYIL